MATPVIYGPDYSTYTRTARLCFEEKPAEYRLEPIDMLGGATKTAAYLARHPFGKVPAFEHDGFAFHEVSAISRYVDQVFPGTRLQPADARQAARMNLVIGIIDSYAYGAIVGKLVWQRLITPMLGGQPDEAIVRDSKPMVEKCLAEFARIKGSDPWLAGSEISLADLYLAPIMAYLSLTPDHGELLQPHAGLKSWWDSMSARPSMQTTAPKMG